MPLQQTSGNDTSDAYGGGVAAVPNYIESVFSTWLYAGNNSTNTITNGIDLSTKGGFVWIKGRQSDNHVLFDTARGTTKYLESNTTDAQATAATSLTSFNTNGFTLGADAGFGWNWSGGNFVSWTFRKQPKFFDVVTYTGTGANRTVSHNLGSVPGCIIIKKTSSADSWPVYHRSLTATSGIVLNSTAAANAGGATLWNSTNPTSTVFTVGVNGGVNQSGETYVAYLFADNAGGFGLTGTDNVISCGSFTGNSSGSVINLGYEPQWLLMKRTDSSTYGDWILVDNMRGWQAGPAVVSEQYLQANTSAAEASNYWSVGLTSTGFSCWPVNGATYIYITIRRGPMKVPTDATTVFAPVATSSATTPLTVTTNFPVDLSMLRDRTGSANENVIDRLRGNSQTTGVYLVTQSTAAEVSQSGYGIGLDNNTAIIDNGFIAGGSNAKIYWNFRRAPSFFDEVCYTGNGATQNINHNLGAVPELMLIKGRSSVNNWIVYSASVGNTKALILNGNNVPITASSWWNNTTPTSSVFSLGGSDGGNLSGATQVAYLFATCAGVSKVGSYTGNGSTQTINCGFTGGARFVLIKRTDATGDWYVYDTARGMTTLTDPYLLLNSTAAESATLGSVTSVTTGFAVNASILAAINTNAATYIYLAIA